MNREKDCVSIKNVGSLKGGSLHHPTAQSLAAAHPSGDDTGAMPWITRVTIQYMYNTNKTFKPNTCVEPVDVPQNVVHALKLIRQLKHVKLK
jgi:hypothetical protein